jgi:asparagine synthase (glutamine-hydrolysing)
MCGVVGILAQNATVPADVLERATLSLVHRGPDDHGTVIIREEENSVEVGLGNRRLAILDLSPLGHQPMQDRSTGNWITYNGEIYNFRVLRARLEQEGDNFVSHSDTEVILKAYARWGEGFVSELRGMFAFAIWDAKRRRLFLARDPMGVKPLYFFKSDRHFLFASEVRTLLGTGLIPRKIDRAGLFGYLTFGSLYDPLTLIEGISSLPAGHTLVWEGGALRQQQYWDIVASDFQIPGASSDTRAAEEEVHAILDEAVRMQLVSDVPVGVFLSGGIDSSALVGILARHGLRASTFSVVFREADYSEAKHSRAIAKHFKTDHHEITASQQDVLDIIPSALGAMDQPTMDGVNTYFVSQKTRDAGVKVALSGLGGDEMFAGYSSFLTVPRMERFARGWTHVPGFIRTPLANAYSLLMPTGDQNGKLASLARDNGRLVHPYFLSRMLFTPSQSDGLLASADAIASRRLASPLLDAVSRAQSLDPVNRVSYLEARCYMLNTLLRDSDFMSMAHGLEVRVPLIDHRLAERVLAMPGRSKLDPTMPKPVLVRALGRELPKEIVHRPKRGFTLPFGQWLHQDLGPEVARTLGEPHGILGDVLNRQSVRCVWDDFERGWTSWTRPWSLYVLDRWCAQHF